MAPKPYFALALSAMESVEVVLPREVLTHMFGHLSACRKDIAACRLVCRTFRAYCSEFLVSRAIFANRLDTIQRLWEVLEHPYFSQHVKELVYDASEYQESLATEFEEYEDACDQHCTRTFYDEQAMEELQTYAQFYHRVCRTRPWRSALDESKKWHTTGVHKGFHDYFRRWLTQKQIIEDGIDNDVLIEALKRLPRLQRIVFTDFRELAHEGEGYSTACKRLFGNTLEPCGLCLSYDIYRQFMLLVDFLAERP